MNGLLLYAPFLGVFVNGVVAGGLRHDDVLELGLHAPALPAEQLLPHAHPQAEDEEEKQLGEDAEEHGHDARDDGLHRLVPVQVVVNVRLPVGPSPPAPVGPLTRPPSCPLAPFRRRQVGGEAAAVEEEESVEEDVDGAQGDGEEHVKQAEGRGDDEEVEEDVEGVGSVLDLVHRRLVDHHWKQMSETEMRITWVSMGVGVGGKGGGVAGRVRKWWAET